MPRTQIAAQLYTVRDFCKTAGELEESLRKLKKIGYEVVQISGIGPIPYPEIKRILDATGMACCVTHIPYERMVNETEQVIQEHNLIQCKYAAIGGLPGGYRNAEGYSRFAREATEVGKKLAAGGLRFGYHNHSFELEKYGKRTGLAILYEDSDPEYFKAEIDTYWIQHGGGDPAAWIEKLSGRIPLVHLKDMTVRNGQPIMAEVGEGNLNWPRIVDACKKAGVEWYIVEQDTCERDPFESLAISLRNIKAMGIT
ncbi:MAG: sugar phosphate isomerase/epimerase family protein [Armatimonadota bacterium]